MMDTIILDFSNFIYISIFVLVFRVPIENLILEKPTIGWFTFFLLIVSSWILFLIPKRIFIEDTDKPRNRSLGFFLILMSILVILVSHLFYFAPEWKSLSNGIRVFNRSDMFIILSVLMEGYVALGIIYTRAKKWLIFVPILILVVLMLSKFNYNSIFNQWLLSFSPFIVGSLVSKLIKKNTPSAITETYKGD